MNQTRKGIWLLAGIYLVYKGITLARDVIVRKPDHYPIYALCGVLFVICGAAFALCVLIPEFKNYTASRRGEAAKNGNEALPADEAEGIPENKAEDEEAAAKDADTPENGEGADDKAEPPEDDAAAE